ncbi:MAG: LON peptidase substrate-binding domain-containing protein [Thermoanaerobaculia bacterium]
MPAAPADTGLDPLPAVLPVFPLTGSLLLPGNFMPLNIFEPRYRNMVEDVLADDSYIGMIQPLVPGPDNQGIGEENPKLYSVGCAGLLERAERQADGRFLILLRGVRRFRADTEIELRRGYRRVRVSYEPFAEDARPETGGVDTAALLDDIDRFAQCLELEFDMELLAALDGPRLVNALAAALPFAPAEQQALLEASTVADRQRLLVELMHMDRTPRPTAASFVPPTVN